MVNATEADNSLGVIMGNLSVNDFPAEVLFDSGASHCFISYPFASKHNLRQEKLSKPLAVVSPAKHLSSSLFVPGVSVKMGSYSSLASPIVLGNSDIDLILGMDWLAMNKALIDCEAY